MMYTTMMFLIIPLKFRRTVLMTGCCDELTSRLQAGETTIMMSASTTMSKYYENGFWTAKQIKVRARTHEFMQAACKHPRSVQDGCIQLKLGGLLQF